MVENVRARLQEEGREARNLVAYSLPLQSSSASSSSSSVDELINQGIFFLLRHPGSYLIQCSRVKLFWDIAISWWFYVLTFVIMPTECCILESASVKNFCIWTKFFIYLDMFLWVADKFVSVWKLWSLISQSIFDGIFFLIK